VLLRRAKTGEPRVPDDLASLFAAERSRPEAVPSAVEERVWGRVGATIGFVPPGGGDGGPGDGGSAGGEASGSGGATAGASDLGSGAGDLGGGTLAAPVDMAATLTATSGASGVIATSWLATTTAKIAIGAALALAGIGGAAIARAPSSTPDARPQVVEAEPSLGPNAPRPPVRMEPAPPQQQPRLEESSPETPSEAKATGSSAPSPSAPSRDAELAEERELLEQSRGALGSGDASGAMALLARHAARHPRGRLGDEREALWIRALVQAGRREEARARFEAFRTRSPGSLLIPAMEAAIGGSR